MTVISNDQDAGQRFEGLLKPQDVNEQVVEHNWSHES